jgi:hypothetical protein
MARAIGEVLLGVALALMGCFALFNPTGIILWNLRWTRGNLGTPKWLEPYMGSGRHLLDVRIGGVMLILMASALIAAGWIHFTKA